MHECFCFGSEAVNASGEALTGLVKSRVGEFHSRLCRSKINRGDGLARSHIPPATQATGTKFWFLRLDFEAVYMMRLVPVTSPRD